MPKCKMCKKPVNKEKNIWKYCSITCRNKYNNAKNRAYQTQWQRNKQDLIASKPAKNKIQCLICKKWYRQVGSHVINTHKILAREYREEYGFDVKRGQLPPDYRKLKAQQCKENGTINNLKAGKKYYFKKGDHTAGKYTRSEQTMQRLKQLHKLKKK